MAGNDELVEIRIRLKDARKFQTDAKGVSRHVSDIGDKADRSGRRMRTASAAARGFGVGLGAMARMAKYAGVALAAMAVAGVGASVKAFAEAEAVMADQAAALKSTGAAAWITSRQLSTMASVQSMRTGVDDEAIASAQTLLLTFVKVRNQVGKNNDMFNQANAVVADFSVRFKKDLSGSAILVGKALNDPVKGVTALGRVGVQFTQQQKDQIKAMAESGNVLGAQKIVMGELRTQTEGAAEAYGKTLAGSLSRAKVIVGNVGEAFGGMLAPGIKASVDWASQFGTTLQTSLGRGASPMSALTTAIGRQFGWQSKTLQVWLKIRAALPKVWSLFLRGIAVVKSFIPHIVKFGRGLIDMVKPAVPFFTNVLLPLFKGLAMGIIAALKGMWAVVGPVLRGFFRALGWIGSKLKPLSPVFQALGGVISFVFGGVIMRAVGALGKLGGVFRFIGKGIHVFGRIIGGIVSVVGKVMSRLVPAFKGGIGKVVSFLKGAGGLLVRAGGALWDKLVDGIKKAISGGMSFVKDIGKKMVNGLVGLLNDLIPDTIPIPGAPNIDLPNNPIPTMASGGMLRAGSAYVGEHGAERATVMPGGGVRIDPLPERMRRRLSSIVPEHDWSGGGGSAAPDDGSDTVLEAHLYVDGEEINVRLGKVVKRKAARR